VPVHPAPVQPVKAEPATGVAVSETGRPPGKGAEQVAGQVMPVGLPVTVPAPAPSGVMVSVKVGVKLAVTVVAAETVTVQGPVPVHPAPLQPVKAEPATGVAVSVTTVPLG